MFSWLRTKAVAARQEPAGLSRPKAPWWEESFSTREFAQIKEAFQPMGSISVENMLQDAGSIGNLVGYLKKENLRHLGYRLLDRAETLLVERPPELVAHHFYLHARGEFFYRWRDLDDFALEASIDAFSRQISIAPEVARSFSSDTSLGFVPGHAGYRQMRIIEEKRGNLEAARALCVKAKSEGWADDWDHVIARIDKKLSARQSKSR